MSTPSARPGQAGQNRPSNARPAGIGASYALNPTPQGRQTGSMGAGYVPVQPMGRTEVITNAPTLGQFWRSDIRHTTGGRSPRWAGGVAFWMGLLSIGLFVVADVFGIVAFAAVALALGAAAVFFALIAIIAGIGRAFGFIGLILAVVGVLFLGGAIIRLVS